MITFMKKTIVLTDNAIGSINALKRGSDRCQLDQCQGEVRYDYVLRAITDLPVRDYKEEIGPSFLNVFVQCSISYASVNSE